MRVSTYEVHFSEATITSFTQSELTPAIAKWSIIVSLKGPLEGINLALERYFIFHLQCPYLPPTSHTLQRLVGSIHTVLRICYLRSEVSVRRLVTAFSYRNDRLMSRKLFLTSSFERSSVSRCPRSVVRTSPPIFSFSSAMC